MTGFVNFLSENVQWIFSGIGVFVLGFFITKKVIKNKSQTIKNKSTGIQAGRDVKINIKK